MIEVEHMGVSPSQAKSKKGNHFCPEESRSEQSHEFGSEYLLTELPENKHQCEYAITQNESAKFATDVSHSGINEPSSEYVAKTSSPKHLGLLPEDMSEHNHTDQSSFPQESGKTHEYGSGYVHKEELENKHQPGSENVQNELEGACTVVCALPAKCSQPLFEDLSKNSITGSLGLSPEDSSKYVQTDNLSCPQLVSAEPTVGFGSGNIYKELGEPLEQRKQHDSQILPNDTEKCLFAASTYVFNQALQSEDTNKSNCGKHLQSPSQGSSNVIQTSKSSHVDPLGLPQEFASGNSSIQQPRLLCEDMAKNSAAEQHETMPKNLIKNSGRGRVGKTSINKKYMLRSVTSSDRLLLSKSQEKSKASDLSNNLADVGSREQQSKRKRKRRREQREVGDEYSRIRRHLRYLLNRINYERSLITAYSTEGWKGLSLEKLKPEKELQRATSEILRRKLKIRDLFQRIDSLCAEGRFPESLFDSEGQIDSEDIFCAKCGSKDLSANNDIILCDGACDRGFHQYCLQPPLLKEEIPPGDESWLCPGCDCKVDCIELVNESQGTSFSLTESWEKLFPEAAGGQNLDPNFGLPSDDSDDNDYNPDCSETDEKDQGDESSSDESDFTSTSEELEVPANVDPYLGLPSDDSEDDDYNPDGPNHDNVAKPASSSSDFTSASEDLGAMLEEDISSQNNEGTMSSRDSERPKPKLGGKKSLNDELLSIMESESGQDGAAVSKKRSTERLDYKRLYDETYGNIPCSSSDDEDWSDATAPRKKKKCNAEAASAPSDGNASAIKSVSVSNGLKQNLEETENEPRRKTRQKSDDKVKDLSTAELQGDTSASGSSGKKAGSSTYKRLGEAVKQKLYKSFKENQYPDRATKENLAKELELTFQQVSKWFDNARWSFNNPPSTKAKIVAENDITSAVKKKN
ncbi:hypothetical protein PTKIN_Ptkin02bG0172800 [Pterospermum kingtungense]